jgi:hypothetical protein
LLAPIKTCFADRSNKVVEEDPTVPSGGRKNRGVVPDHKVDGFNSQAAPVRPPQAAMFDKGASSLPEIQDDPSR